MRREQPQRLNGRHMTAVFVCFFAVVIVANVLMARLATSTFGGVVVENSYVASQKYNRWLDEAERERALGWSVNASRLADQRVQVTIAGPSARPLVLSGDARHPLGRLPDRALAFAPAGGNRFVSAQPLPLGRWRLRLTVEAGGDHWRGEVDVP